MQVHRTMYYWGKAGEHWSPSWGLEFTGTTLQFPQGEWRLLFAFFLLMSSRADNNGPYMYPLTFMILLLPEFQHLVRFCLKISCGYRRTLWLACSKQDVPQAQLSSSDYLEAAYNSPLSHPPDGITLASQICPVGISSRNPQWELALKYTLLDLFTYLSDL